MPSALAKLKPLHPLSKCLGFFLRFVPCAPVQGKPMEAGSNFHPRAVSLSFAISCCGLTRGRKKIHAHRETISAVLGMCRRRRRPKLSLHDPRPDAFGSTSGRVAPFVQNAGRCSAVLVLPPCWLASIPLFQGPQTGRASAAQILNRVAGSSQFAVPSGCH